MNLLQNPPPFAHKVNGGLYWGSADKCATLKEYKDYLRFRYGDLRGVKVLEFGKDFDGILIIGESGHAVKDGRYV